MTELALRVLVRVHGLLGALAVAALVHPAVLLARGRRRVLLACAASTATATVAATLGMVLYPEYRQKLKQGLFLAAPRVGWLFERKEHLGAGALVVAWAGLALVLASERAPADEMARALRRASVWAYALAAGMALVTGALGVAVAAHRSF